MFYEVYVLLKVTRAASFEEVWYRRFTIRSPEMHPNSREASQLFVKELDCGPGTEPITWPGDLLALPLAFPIPSSGSGSC